MGHFYYNDKGIAKPLWEVPYASPRKGTRPATLADARKRGGVPSPNTIMDVLSKPGLIRWSDNLLITAVLSTPTETPMADFRKAVLAKHKELKQEKAELGTQIHAEIEKVLLGTGNGQLDYPKIVGAAVLWLKESGIEVDGIEQYFVNPFLGFGGMIDVVGVEFDVELESEHPAIVDWKSIDTKGKRFHAYPKDKTPLLAAYAMGYFGTLDVKCWNVFLSRDEPGLVIPKLYSPDEMAWGWTKFQKCFDLWIMEKDYDPRETE
jgi:hypothetical protein